jgi:hypothetical protein
MTRTKPRGTWTRPLLRNGASTESTVEAGRVDASRRRRRDIRVMSRSGSHTSSKEEEEQVALALRRGWGWSSAGRQPLLGSSCCGGSAQEIWGRTAAAPTSHIGVRRRFRCCRRVVIAAAVATGAFGNCSRDGDGPACGSRSSRSSSSTTTTTATITSPHCDPGGTTCCGSGAPHAEHVKVVRNGSDRGRVRSSHGGARCRRSASMVEVLVLVGRGGTRGLACAAV